MSKEAAQPQEHVCAALRMARAERLYSEYSSRRRYLSAHCMKWYNFFVTRPCAAVRAEYIMLKLAVCDDEKVFRSDLKRILATELELCGIDYHITEFDSGEALIAGLEKTDCQLLFLDIEMKGMDGVAAARKLREMKRQMEIIFVTSYADFVFQGYEVRALNYILKPYEPERIASVLHTALEALDIDAEKYYVIEQKGVSGEIVNNMEKMSSEK